MPLQKCKPGDSDDRRASIISSNISELMKAWENTSQINGDKITTRKEALRRAIAIATSNCKKPNKKEE